MAKKLKKVVKYTVAIALAAVLLWMALRGIDWNVFLEGLKQTRWGFVVLSVGCALCSNIFRAERWRDLMLPIDPNASRRRLWDSLNIGNAVSVAVPWAGLLVRTGAVKGNGASYDKTLGTILMERTWDMLMVLLLIISAVLANSGDIARFLIDKVAVPFAGRMNLVVCLVLLALIALAAGGIWFIYHFRKQWPLMDKLASWIDGTLVGFKSFKDVRYKGRFVFYSMMVWLTYAAMCWCVFQAVPALEHLNFADALFISSVGSLSSLVPVPGGFGAYHYLVALAISTIYGASWETGILFATLNHESRALLLLVLGGISSVSSQLEGKKKAR